MKSLAATLTSSSSWFEHVLVDRDCLTRLFCLPYAGGSASINREWRNGPLQRCEVNPVQLPGRERRIAEPSFARMNQLVPEFVRNLPLDKPYALFGHSLGGIVAFEAVREIVRRGLPPPAHLFVSGTTPPQLCPNRPPRFALSRENLIEEIRKLGGTPEEVIQTPELLDLMLPILRADFAVLDTYHYRDGDPLPCPISAFASDRDAEVTPIEALDWRHQTQREFHFELLPGDHFFINSQGARLRQIVGGIMARLGDNPKLEQ